MNTALVQPKEGVAEATPQPTRSVAPVRPDLPLRLRTLLCLPICLIITLAIHYFSVRSNLTAPETRAYIIFLAGAFGLSLFLAIIHPVARPVKDWIRQIFPILGAAVLFLGGWDLLTTGFRQLPLPYFPGPGVVIFSMVSDRQLLFESTWHSLVLLGSGYLIGVAVALVTGICIGWYPQARYWGMPFLKVIGPIPATAWVPLAMILFSGRNSAMGLIALAVWFPVSMLTISGIANTRSSYIDVARTLGASPRYLIFRVAIPAAMPSIFIGLFMGLGTSFLTLITAETVGVKSGLGWYVSWAMGWAEYGKVYGALVIMAAFFSTIMTILFKVRDRILVWQKGVIKW